MNGTKLREIPAGADADRVPSEALAGDLRGTRRADQQPAAGSNACGARAIWGWSPRDLPADTALKRGIDRILPRTGLGFIVYWAVVFALEFSLAPHLPMRGRLSVAGVAALLGAAWCGLNFWRCRHAHCAVSTLGWSALGGLAIAEVATGHSLIGGYDQLAFLGVLVLALIFEGLWATHGTWVHRLSPRHERAYTARHAVSVSKSRTTGLRAGVGAGIWERLLQTDWWRPDDRSFKNAVRALTCRYPIAP